jgi:hypothetical protein
VVRARGIKPGLFKNELLGTADPLLTILFAGLWCMADREGRLEDRPLRISAEVFPYRREVTERRVDQLLAWLAEHKFIVRYDLGEKTTACDQKRYIQISEFHRHQRPHSKERASEIPALSGTQHQPGSGEGNGEHQPKSDQHALTPSSLTPHSLTPHSPEFAPGPVLPPGGGGKGKTRKTLEELEAEARARGEDIWAMPGAAAT